MTGKLAEAIAIASAKDEAVKELDFGNVFWACGVLADEVRSYHALPVVEELKKKVDFYTVEWLRATYPDGLRWV